MSTMQEFHEQLASRGLSADTVNIGSHEGAGSGSPTKHKTYYQAQDFPALGVLIMRESESVAVGLCKLAAEIANYAKLAAVGFRVPEFWSAQEYVDEITGQGPVAGLVIEHIDGAGPWKASTQYRSLMRWANALPETARARAEADWVALQAACTNVSPGDWQIMVRNDGSLFTIDPECVTSAPVRLPAWTEHERVGAGSAR